MSLREDNSDSENGGAGKRRRVGTGNADAFDLGGPIEDEETAIEKLEEAGFDPNNITEYSLVSHPRERLTGWEVTPMSQFACAGDLKMCRYLLKKGASVASRDESNVWCPMVAAALFGNIEVCEWLYRYGASEDVWRTFLKGGKVGGGTTTVSALRLTMTNSERKVDAVNACKWLIFKGALTDGRSDGIFSKNLVNIAFTDNLFFDRDVNFVAYWDELNRVNDCVNSLLNWANEDMLRYKSYQTFLFGTLPAQSFSFEPRRNNLSYLNGNPGIFELISDFVGVPRGRRLRIKRQLAECLPLYSSRLDGYISEVLDIRDERILDDLSQDNS